MLHHGARAAAGYDSGGSATRGLFSNPNTIQYITVETAGNSTNFGSITSSLYTYMASSASSTRAVFGSNVSIDYATIATTGNTTYFGAIGYRVRDWGGASNDTRGIFSCGWDSARGNLYGTWYDGAVYVTIATTGNAIGFSSPSLDRGPQCCASTTRVLHAGGYFRAGNGTYTYYNAIKYDTISTGGTTNTFGSLVSTNYYMSACSSPTRGVFLGGAQSSSMQYVTIATTGNSTSYGTFGAEAACSSKTIGVGATSSAMWSFVIDTSGTTTSFGSLATTGPQTGTSNNHGGI